MSSFLFLLVASAFVTLANAQCALKQQEHPNCAGWLSNGFCTSPFYTPNQRAFYCGNACGLCCQDADKNCPRYQAASFCQNRIYTPAQKAAVCAKTCNLCSAVATTPKPTTTTNEVPDVGFNHASLYSTMGRWNRSHNWNEVKLAGKKATSVKLPDACSFEFAKKANPATTSPTDYFEVIGVEGPVTAASTGAATTLFAKCMCATNRACAATIDSAGTSRVQFVFRKKDIAYEDLKLAGTKVERVDVPNGCTFTLADDAIGANAEMLTKPEIVSITKSFASCSCP